MRVIKEKSTYSIFIAEKAHFLVEKIGENDLRRWFFLSAQMGETIWANRRDEVGGCGGHIPHCNDKRRKQKKRKCAL